MKRFIDIVLSFAALIVLMPLFGIIMVILRVTGEGEIFFVQRRVGLKGETFGLIKFATMLKDSPNMSGGVLTTRNDPRVLPVGKFFRKTKINELPQLFNILLGHMSVVGPRPQAPSHFGAFPAHVRKEIVKVRPGLTGIGSVVFRDEESIMARSAKGSEKCYEEDIAPYKGELELWYIRNQSVCLDFILIFLTAWVVFFPRSELYRFLFKELPPKSPELSNLSYIS